MRRFAIILLAVALGFQVVRTAVMDRPFARNVIGARLWPSHPALIIDRTMGEIGALARRGQAVPPTTLRQVQVIADKSPLAPEPFLIQGAVAQTDGQDERAERLFAAARMRDPRSEAARYFLTDRYLRTGRIADALVEMAAFSRLVPTSWTQFAPALASFAHTPGAVPQLRAFFRASPEFEAPVLAELAGDVRNTDLILALANPQRGPAQPWQTKILEALVGQGQFVRAYAVWKNISGVRTADGGLFNPRFAAINAPPPFNWTFATQGGVVEPSDGRLKVIYYGREDAILARQLLLLTPGRYQLGMEVKGQASDGSAVTWSVICLPQNRPILSLPLKRGEKVVAVSFSVPQDCSAQRLDLTGSSGEFPQSLDFAIGKLRLTQVAGR